MRATTKAILWEVTARNAAAVKFAVSLLPLCALVVGVARLYVYFFGQQPQAEQWQVVLAVSATALSALLSLTSLFWSFSFTSIDERGRFGGFPVRLFTLPLHTWRAAAPPLLAGVAALGIAYLLWVGLVWIALAPRQSIPWLALAWQLLTIANGFVAVQVIVWLLYPFRFTRMVMITIVAITHFVFFVSAPAVDFKGHAEWYFAGGLTALAAWFRAAFAVIAWERRGSWSNVRWLIAKRFVTPAKKFASAFAAQLWFEWRRKGWFGAGVIGVTMGLSLMVWTVPTGMLLIAAENYSDLPPLFEQSFLWLAPLMTAFISFAIGSAFGKSDPWAGDIAMSSFHAVRPMSTSDLVFAKMRTAFRTIAIAWCICLVVVLALTFTHPHARAWLMNEFWPRFTGAHPRFLKWIINPFVLLTIFGLQWHIVVSGMCTVLSGKPWRVAIAGWITVLTSSVAIGAIYWFSVHEEHFRFCRPVLPVFIGAIAFWKIGRAVVAFLRARRELLNALQTTTLVLIWIGLISALGISTALALDAKRLPPEFILFMAVWLMPSGEMPMCALNLATNRHR